MKTKQATSQVPKHKKLEWYVELNNSFKKLDFTYTDFFQSFNLICNLSKMKQRLLNETCFP